MGSGSISIMQPYTFPYVGYFHLIEASSLTVFYDDVNYIKGGWINRNRILCQGQELLFTVPVSKASQNKLITEIKPAMSNEWISKFFSQLEYSYKKAPFYSNVIDLIRSVFCREYTNISDLAIESIKMVYSYLGKTLTYENASVCSPGTQGLEKADRLIRIVKEQGFGSYVNLPGGRDLYSCEYFANRGVSLLFLESDPVEYRQFDGAFVPGLSIIDVLMFNDVLEVVELLKKYKLQ